MEQTASKKEAPRTARGTPYRATSRWSRLLKVSTLQRSIQIWSFAFFFAIRYFLTTRKFTYGKKVGLPLHRLQMSPLLSTSLLVGRWWFDKEVEGGFSGFRFRVRFQHEALLDEEIQPACCGQVGFRTNENPKLESAASSLRGLHFELVIAGKVPFGVRLKILVEVKVRGFWGGCQC